MRGKIFFCAVALVLLVGIVSADTYLFSPTSDLSCDYTNANSTYSQIIGGSCGVNNDVSVVDYAVKLVTLSSTDTNLFDQNWRFKWRYNTSSIPDNETITSAAHQFKIYASGKSNGLGNYSVVLVNGTATGTEVSDRIGYGSIPSSGNFSMPLNSGGLNYINKLGNTDLFIMMDWDRDGSFGGTWGNNTFSGLYMYTNNHATSGNRPKLTVETTTGDTTPPASLSNITNTTTCNAINISFTPPTGDYNGSLIWWNDIAQPNLTSTDIFKLFDGLIENTQYTFASKTFDNATPPNINTSFTNHTATTRTSVIASFTKNQTAGLQPLPVMFNDTSTGSSINQWNWSFGDGSWQNGTTQNATKIYSSGGEYSIFLISSNVCGSNTSAPQTITVYNQTLSGFSANITEGLTPLSVLFSVTDPNDNATFWNWSFGDGTWQNGTTQNATKIYSTGGLYTVTEIAGTTGSSSTTTITDYINVWNQTSISSFNANVTIGDAPLAVSFTDVSYNATNWYTEFGDGNTSILKNPEFTYTIPGLYTVNHRAYSDNHSSWLNQTDYINVTVPVIAPVTEFSANATSGISPLSVSFTDSSTNTPTNWDWYFWGNETKCSDLQNPEQVFTTGLYDIRLYSSNSAGGDWENKTAYINVTAPPAPPTAIFTGLPTSGNAPLFVTFTDASINTPLSWYWEFGDENTSVLQNPTNTYGTPGNYSVNLKVTNADGFDWENKTNYITVNIPPTPTSTPTPIPVTQNFNRDQRIVDPLTWVKNWLNDIRHIEQ